MATYNCTDSTNNTYGSGSFGICTGQSVGASNTGVFEQIMSAGSFTIMAPLAAAIVIIAVATAFVGLRKRSTRNG